MATGKRVPLPMKIEAVKELTSGNFNEKELEKKYKVGIATIKKWRWQTKNSVTPSDGKQTPTPDIKDVIVFLERAETAILRGRAKRMTPAETYAMLALTTLRGG